jgi:anti-sigma factor RsiW
MNPAFALVDKYLDDLLSADEATQLAQLLLEQPEAATALARATRAEACLIEQFHAAPSRARAETLHLILGKQDGEEVPRSAPTKTQWRHRWVSRAAAWQAAAAAALVLASGIGLFYFLGKTETPLSMVASGRVLVNGVESLQIRDGAEVEVIGEESAVIHLADGSRAELAPASRAVIRGGRRRGAPVLELAQGSGEFEIGQGPRPFHVETPVGKITASGTDFSVELRPGENNPEASLSSNMTMALIVDVIAGNIDVQYGNHSYALGVGDNRLYAGRKQAPSGKPSFAGKVVALAEDGKSMTLELPAAEKDGPPVRKIFQLSEQTKFSYVNVPLSGERPTVGYQASVWLEEGADAPVLAVTFSARKPNGPPPDFAGRLSAVSANGKEITVQLPPKKKGDPARTAIVKLSERSKIAYALVPFDAERPMVGYTATVWLTHGSKEEAARITFTGKKADYHAPDLVGRVTAVAPDGQHFTLQLPPSKNGEPGRTTSVTIGKQTKIVYSKIEEKRQKPSVGFTASIWLEKGSKEQATGVKFGDGPKPRPVAANPAPQKPADPFRGVFALPKEIELTSGQKAQLLSMVGALTLQQKELAKRRSTVLSAEQQAALAIANRAVRQAGLTDRHQIQEALDAAASLTPEQKERMKAIGDDETALRRQFLDKLDSVLTDAQRTQQPRARDHGDAK